MSIYVKSSRVYTSIASDAANLSFYPSCDLVAKINLAERYLTLPSRESSKYSAGANTIAAGLFAPEISVPRRILADLGDCKIIPTFPLRFYHNARNRIEKYSKRVAIG